MFITTIFYLLPLQVSSSTSSTDVQSVEPETLLHAQLVDSIKIRSQKGLAVVDALVLSSCMDPGEFHFVLSDNARRGEEGESNFDKDKELELLKELGPEHLPFVIKA